MHKNIPVYLFIVLQFLFVGVWVGCNDQIVDTGLVTSNNKICFTKLNNGRGQIFTANIDGTNLTNISADYPYTDEYPLWSPNGKYIVFQRTAPFNSPNVYTYNFETGKLVNLTSEGTVSITTPKWTPDNKVYFSYRVMKTMEAGVHLVNPDGTDKINILKFETSKLFFTKTGNSFFYIKDEKLLKTNTIGTINEFILDLINPKMRIRDYNPNSNEFLISINNDSTKELVLFNLQSNSIKSFLKARTSFGIGDAVYSKDFKKIAFIELGQLDYYLNTYESGLIKQLVHIEMRQPNSFDYFGWAPLDFSSNGDYIVYTKVCFLKGQNAIPKINVSYMEYLYVVNTKTGKIDSLGIANNPCFNPNP